MPAPNRTGPSNLVSLNSDENRLNKITDNSIAKQKLSTDKAQLIQALIKQSGQKV